MAENKETKQDILDNIAKFCDEYNKAVLASDFRKASHCATDIDDLVGKYTSIVRQETFEICRLSEDPMLSAVTMRTFQTVAVRDTKDENKLPVKEFGMKAKEIDLEKLNTYCKQNGGTGIGHDAMWIYILEQFNYRVACRFATKIGFKDIKTLNDSYAMSQLASEIELGFDVSSDDELLKALQYSVDAMLGKNEDGSSKYPVDKIDVEYLLSVYAKRSNKPDVKGNQCIAVPKHTVFRTFMADVCHRVVLKKDYGVSYQVKKA